MIHLITWLHTSFLDCFENKKLSLTYFFYELLRFNDTVTLVDLTPRKWNIRVTKKNYIIIKGLNIFLFARAATEIFVYFYALNLFLF